MVKASIDIAATPAAVRAKVRSFHSYSSSPASLDELSCRASYQKILVGHKQTAARRLRRPALSALMTLTAPFTKLGKACWMYAYAYGPLLRSVERPTTLLLRIRLYRSSERGAGSTSPY